MKFQPKIIWVSNKDLIYKIPNAFTSTGHHDFETSFELT